MVDNQLGRVLTFRRQASKKCTQYNFIEERADSIHALNVTTERISSLCKGKEGYSSILSIHVGMVPLVLINIFEFTSFMRKTTQKVPMKKLSLYLPSTTVDDVERIRGFYSLNRWCWKAITKQLQEEMSEKNAIKV